MNARFLLIMLLVAAPSCARAAGPGESINRVRAFYFGNSLTENTMPPFQVDLGKSAGKEWACRALIGPGAALFKIRDDLEKDAWAPPHGKSKTMLTGQVWDAIVLQPGMWLGLSRKGADTSGWVKEPDREVGDIESAAGIIDIYLRAHPTGKVFIYEAWPGIPPKEEARPGGAAPQRAEDRVPDKEAFDYEKHWLLTYDPGLKWKGNTWATRDYSNKLIDALAKKYPQLVANKRLAMIPAGEVFFALNKKLRAGKAQGIGDIEDFYTDLIHLRSGLPRYTVAATFFAVLFREDPAKLDWKIYNDPAAYRAAADHPDPSRRFYIHLPDLGEHLPITAERAKLINETIWEVVKNHPHTGLATSGR